MNDYANLRRVLLAVLAAPLIAFLILAGLAINKANSAECSTEAIVRADIAKWNDGTVVSALNTAETMAFLALYNIYPPIEHLTGDAGLLVYNVNKPKVIMVNFNNGCATNTLFMSKEVFGRIMSGKGPEVPGEPA